MQEKCKVLYGAKCAILVQMHTMLGRCTIMCVYLITMYLTSDAQTDDLRCVHTNEFCLPFYDGDKIGRGFKRATFDLDMLISF